MIYLLRGKIMKNHDETSRNSIEEEFFDGRKMFWQDFEEECSSVRRSFSCVCGTSGAGSVN